MTAFPDFYPATAMTPFDLNQAVDYQTWRDRKIARFPASVDAVKIDIADIRRLSANELAAVNTALESCNLVIYRTGEAISNEKTAIRTLGRQAGLERLDGNLCADEDSISSIRIVDERSAGEYIPYTDKPLNWHTDGYYNTPDRQIRAIVMHCAQPAARGGENAYLDHEIAYIKLRDENPQFIAALMEPDVMTIPANEQNGKVLRPEQTGPVFSVDAEGYLHMRYSARAHNVVWKEDAVTREARDFLTDLLKQDSTYIFRHRLAAGEGIISNNVLHCRTAFENDAASGQERLLYRARYFDRARTGAK